MGVVAATLDGSADLGPHLLDAEPFVDHELAPRGRYVALHLEVDAAVDPGGRADLPFCDGWEQEF